MTALSIEQHPGAAAARHCATPASHGAAQGPQPGAVPSGIAGLDALLEHGGLPYGSLVTLREESSAGLRRLAARIVLAAQQRGDLVCYVDLGGGFDAAAAEACGVDLAGLLRAQPASSDEALALLAALAASGDARLVVVDTLNPLLEAAGQQLHGALEHIVASLGRSQTLLLGLLAGGPPAPRHATLALAECAALQIEVAPAGAVEQHALFSERTTVTALRARVTVTPRGGRPARRSVEVALPLAGPTIASEL